MIDVGIEQKDKILIAHVRGELDSQSAPLFQETMMPLITPRGRILLDMSGVEYLSSIGLRSLLLLYRQINQQGGHIVLVALQEMVRDTMSITGFLDFFDDYLTVDEGLTALHAAY